MSSPSVSPRASTAERLSVARDLLARAHDHGMRGRRGAARPDVASGAGVLPVAAPLAGLFPGGGLPRGATIDLGHTSSSMSVLFALMAQASAAGAWAAAVGLPQLGAVAASEAGIELSRLALIPDPRDQLVSVVAAAAEGIELVAVAGCARLSAKQRQALAARVRARGAVLFAMDVWPGADFRVAVGSGSATELGAWRGLSADGHGRLRQRPVQIRLTGHGLSPRGRAATVLMPGPDGALCPADPRPDQHHRTGTSLRRRAS